MKTKRVTPSPTPGGTGVSVTEAETREAAAGRQGRRDRPTAAASNPPEALPFYRRGDWLAFALTTLLVLAGYLWTLAPDVTLEDSGEMAVAAHYAGVPHAPGYPVWTLYSWVVTKLLPFSNIAWRVAVGSAVAGAFACGFVALMTSRASRSVLAGHPWFADAAEAQTTRRRRSHSTIGTIAGTVAGLLLAFTGFVWSQAVIVEVYTLSLLSLTSMMACLLRWMHVPQQRRYLYLAWFLFGICLNNHQSLVVAALAIEVCVILADPRLGRDLLLGNVVCYLAGLVAIGRGWILEGNAPLIACYNAIGLGSIAAMVWLIGRTRGLGRQFGAALACGAAFLGGAVFYLWMPVTSMSNPPMNWAYPRTVQGFFHALTRGQYESPHPVTGLLRYLEQLWHLALSAVTEFGAGCLLLGAVSFLLLRRLARRERGWLIGGIAFYLVLGPGLLVLLNPETDRATQNLVRVFFGASHVMIAMAVGLGVTAGLGLMGSRANLRRPVLAVCGAWLALQLGTAFVTWSTTQLPLARGAALAGLVLAGCAVALAALRGRERLGSRVSPIGMAILVCLLPLPSMLSHWWDNEQRGHLFGFWFGHDMFSPPFRAADGRLISDRDERARAMAGADGRSVYPEMARDAVLFGGTDPGRFCPTYMIFSESFIPAGKRRDPGFDRRDVRIITQNALADGHYLEYIRAHYNRSAQQDPYFFSELLRGGKEREENLTTNVLARLALPLDRALSGIGTSIERQRRADGLYPERELVLPTDADHNRAMREYMLDFQARAQRGQLRPGEVVRMNGDRAQVTGQAAVMGINALLTREIFEKNPGHEFYVEESFPIDWMYPHLTPFGTILKLERQPPKELGPEIVARDRRFWGDYMERLMGDWVKPDTNISEICEFAERVHRRQDLSEYRGDRKFIRDEQAQKAFSKLRSSIGGVYDWRFRNATGQLQVVTQQLTRVAADVPGSEALRAEQRRLTEEQARMFREAELAYKQAYALCPVSPEALQRLVNLLLAGGRVADAAAIAETSSRLDPGNAFYTNVAGELRRMQRGA